MLFTSACVLTLTACSNFFTCTGKSSCPASGGGGGGGGGGTTTTGGDYAYVATTSVTSSTTASGLLSAYAIASGKLTSLGSVSVPYIPVAVTVAPSDSFLYVATAPGYTTPGIYLYSIGSTGALTAANSGNALAVDTVASMAISPDGKWLYTVNSDGLVMTQYSVDTSTGALTIAGQVTLPGTPCNLTTATPVSESCSVTVSPSKQFVVASLGISGEYVFPFTTTNGISQTGAYAISSGYSTSNPVGNFSATLDANNYLYVAQTNSVSVYGITSSAYTSQGTVTYASGSVPRGITLSTNNQYVYTANEGAGTISAFGISGSGALNSLSGSPFAGPANVSALGVDNTGGYLVAVGYDANAGVQLYSISSAGVLSQVNATGSGTNTAFPALVAMTH